MTLYFDLTFEQGVNLPYGDGPEGAELAERELHEEEWETYRRQHQDVRHQKRPWEKKITPNNKFSQFIGFVIVTASV